VSETPGFKSRVSSKAKLPESGAAILFQISQIEMVTSQSQGLSSPCVPETRAWWPPCFPLAFEGLFSSWGILN
jgi:hypothetical protein